LVNSIIDGMNLVAKEGALLNERNGVLILSEGAGAVSQLGEHAIIIGPTDVEGTADALHRALTMPLEERRRRAEGLRRSVETDDVTKWFENQVADMLAYKREPDTGEEGGGDGRRDCHAGQHRLPDRIGSRLDCRRLRRPAFN
ncbi:MAG: trehalose-6-phosphate synthase, partial [Thermomicrobiales bacterium]|nr:trehalose-6-phosphate synthase [Thermomicrobiales bacterium]